ncbi:MAG: hypothetical protein ACKVQU_25325 [Burkholderiales bacterium]
MQPFELAPQDRITAYAETAREFFRVVLDIDYDECLVTDESRLSDFASCGLPDEIADATVGLKTLYAAWDAWVTPVICERYKLFDVAPTVLLVDLFERIEQRRLTHLH